MLKSILQLDLDRQFKVITQCLEQITYQLKSEQASHYIEGSSVGVSACSTRERHVKEITEALVAYTYLGLALNVNILDDVFAE